jgi:hypothetical protein
VTGFLLKLRQQFQTRMFDAGGSKKLYFHGLRCCGQGNNRHRDN